MDNNFEGLLTSSWRLSPQFLVSLVKFRFSCGAKVFVSLHLLPAFIFM